MYQNYQEQYGQQGSSRALTEEHVKKFFMKMYAYLAMALTISGGIALLLRTTYETQFMDFIAANPNMIWIIIFVPLGLVFIMSFGIHKIGTATATILLVLYSALMGVWLAAIFMGYNLESIYQVFFITAGTFAVMSAYGFFTKANLSSWGNILFMALIGIIIASVVNFFIGSDALYWGISIVGVLVFVGLTAYDTWKFKQIAYSNQGAPNDVISKHAIIGALNLYLDFVNLLLFLLRFLGGRR